MLTTTLIERDEKFTELNAYPAILNKDINYPKNGKTITVKKNTQILVDLNADIALIGEDHVAVFEYERTLLFS